MNGDCRLFFRAKIDAIRVVTRDILRAGYADSPAWPFSSFATAPTASWSFTRMERVNIFPSRNGTISGPVLIGLVLA